MVLDDLPGVVESAVIGAPHPDFGEGVVAVVVGEGEPAALIAEARKQLAGYKAPKALVFVKELPRNAMGKVTKAALRKTYADIFKG
jgi:malonyl-CoA/methylmalonyl-CoA synthetase